jgi:hypothetical protein
LFGQNNGTPCAELRVLAGARAFGEATVPFPLELLNPFYAT